MVFLSTKSALADIGPVISALDKVILIMYIIPMRGLNKKQREFLVDIFNKITVYLSTVTLIGMLIGRSAKGITLIIFLTVIFALVFVSLYLLKGGDQDGI